MFSRQIVRAAPAHALILAACLALLPAHAAPTLQKALAKNAALSAAAPIAEVNLMRRARLAQVKLSPDGATIAFLESDDKGQHLTVLATRTNEKKRLLTLAGRQELHWSSDSSMLFLDSGDGLANVTLADGTSGKLAAFDRKTEQRFIAIDPHRPRHALTDSYDRAGKLYRINRVAADGSTEVVYESDRKAMEFLLDEQGKVNFIHTLDADFTPVISQRQGDKWVEVTRCKRLRACTLVGAGKGTLNMLVNHADDRKTLVQLNLATKASRVLHTDPERVSDLRQVIVSPASGEPLFAVYDMPERRNYGLTPAAKQAARDIAKRFPDSNISIGASDSAPRWLLTERGARLQQERYWLYERAARRITPLLEQERALGQPLAEEQLARKIALRYRASDGVTAHGYLSLPPGKDASTLPMMTLVHGGPWGKFDSDYTTLVQMLVNRGVAVFQPNFRASTGYGDKYTMAPGSDFGNGRVQADIIDGVRWLLASGVGDKRRLGIMGDSFGGYATLLALTHTPDLFQFGMAMVPPTDFVRTMKNAAAGPGYGDEPPFSVTLAEMGVDLANTAAMQRITDASPAANAARIGKPLLIIAGGKDKMVDIAGVTDFVATVQGLDKPVTLLVDPEEGHSPRKQIVRQAYTHLLQAMVHQYFGGPAASVPSPELAKYLEQHIRVNTALK